ncbi:MAG: Arginase [Candidatus Kaiserbacteria bacterium GW2011_GWB1_52_6]|nr:MAG: Arginase [Candidatus Kaiserbacteria bacterium GW2011_GWA2_52_12]KKW27740.1 MAG: Arginase [Candidatus Kaiserbacteria bacterium GW2011_GWB1_52_6]
MTKDNLSFYERKIRGHSIAIIGIPIELGSDERGLAEAPHYLLNNGLETVIRKLGNKVSSLQMISCPKPAHMEVSGTTKYLKEIAKVARVSSEVVAKALGRGDVVVALGGDHSAAIGTIATVAATAMKKIGVIYIDAHPDINTPDTTITGNIHGMTAAAVMGFGHPLLLDVGDRAKKIAPENFLYIGLKDMDQKEIEVIRERSISTITMLDIAAHGLAPTIVAIDDLRRRVDTIWISMDMDSIDKEYAPGVGMAVSGGLTRREVLGLAQYIGKTCTLTGFDIVEMSPHKDTEGKTARLALELIARFLGTEYSWYQNEYIDVYRETNVTKMNNGRTNRRSVKRVRVSRKTTHGRAQVG